MDQPLVVVVGSVNLDTTLDVQCLPIAGETVLATGARMAVGGKGANQAVASARQGEHGRPVTKLRVPSSHQPGAVQSFPGLSDVPLSSGALNGLGEALLFVVPHASDDSIGEVAFVGAASFSTGLALRRACGR